MTAKNKSSFGGSFHLGRLLGIDVHLHFTFLLLLAFIGLSHGLAGRSAAAALSGVLFFAGLFVCVLFHEFGHALAARRYGIGTRDITLLPIGGVARLERMPDKPSQEFVVALAGPAVNVVIAAALFAGLWFGGHWQPLATLSPTHGNLFERLLVANVFLVVFNLLPAFPMDGGRVLRAVLAMRMPYARATRIAARIGQGMAAVFGFAGLFGNPMLLLIAVFVWIGAAQEAAAVEMKTSFAGATVREAMLTDFRTLGPRQTLADAARLVLAGSQQDFPVVDGDSVVGILAHRELFLALREQGELTPVADVMRREFAVLSADAPLETALTPENVAKGLAMPVLDRGRLVGLVTAENVGEFFMIRAALQARGGRAALSPGSATPSSGRPPRWAPPPILGRQPGA
ncbi:MAG TPA: site-2 protease family protein [Verrucomicrobiota bacterium]|nr:site-2 protease family protein [Verrucomicrobiota bacterium]HNU50371.1 site-2 protease family protein [Verrucomicrobiota bacterium]